MGAMLCGKIILGMDNILLKLSFASRSIFRSETEAPIFHQWLAPSGRKRAMAKKPPTIIRWIVAA